MDPNPAQHLNHTLTHNQPSVDKDTASLLASPEHGVHISYCTRISSTMSSPHLTRNLGLSIVLQIDASQMGPGLPVQPFRQTATWNS